MKIFIIYVSVLAVMSIIAFFTYLSDKRKAVKGEWRIREAVLLGLGLFGGAIGALLSMQLFRHKIRRWYFWVVNLFSLILHVLGGVVIFLIFV